MATVHRQVLAFHPPEKDPTPLEARLARIATSGEITRSVATAKLPHKKASEAAHVTVSTPGRTVKDSKSLFIGQPTAFQPRPATAQPPKRPLTARKRESTAEIGVEIDPIVKRVFEPDYNWPNPYAKDREARALPTEPLTTVLFGTGKALIPVKKQAEKRKMKAIEQEGNAVLALPAPPLAELPTYSAKRSSSLSNIRLRERIKAKIAPKVAAWKQEVADILAFKRGTVQQERARLIAWGLLSENDQIVKDFEEIKAKFEAQRKEVQTTLQEVRAEREEFSPELPPARYPASKAILKATQDVQTWFQTQVLPKHQLIFSAEKWASKAPDKLTSPSPNIDAIYLTEVQSLPPTRPVFSSPKATDPTPKLQVEFHTPEDSFEEVREFERAGSEDSFEEIA